MRRQRAWIPGAAVCALGVTAVAPARAQQAPPPRSGFQMALRTSVAEITWA